MALPTLRTIAFILGIFLITLSMAMLVPMATLLLMEHPEDLQAFIWSALITFSSGLAMVLQGKPKDSQLRPRDMYMLTTSIWLMV